MRENGSCGKVIYIGDVPGPEKENDTCVKTLPVGTMDRGFTIHIVFNLCWGYVPKNTDIY